MVIAVWGRWMYDQYRRIKAVELAGAASSLPPPNPYHVEEAPGYHGPSDPTSDDGGKIG